MQRRKTSVWTPDTDPRSGRQRQESQPLEKENQPEQPEPKTQVAQELRAVRVWSELGSD